MTRYLVTYHGGGPMPDTEQGREQVMAAFGTWVAATGSALVDPGAPLGPTSTVLAAPGAAGQPGEPLADGYSIIDAVDIDDATDLLTGHPFLARGGQLRLSPVATP